MKIKNIGFNIPAPKTKSKQEEKKSPFTGDIKVRGRVFTGTVISAKMTRTATVEWDRRVKLPKYERYMKKRTRVKAHNPDIIKAEEGDIVKIMECRPLSKTKNFVIVENLGKEKGYAQKKEALEESKKAAVKHEEVAEESKNISEEAPAQEETAEKKEE